MRITEGAVITAEQGIVSYNLSFQLDLLSLHFFVKVIRVVGEEGAVVSPKGRTGKAVVIREKRPREGGEPTLIKRWRSSMKILRLMI